MGEELPYKKTHDKLDLTFRFLFLFGLIFFLGVLCCKIFCSPDQSTVLAVLTIIIGLFAICGAFFFRVEYLKIGPIEAKMAKLMQTRDKLELTARDLIKNMYDIPEEFPLKPVDGIVDASNLKRKEILQLSKYRKKLDELNQLKTEIIEMLEELKNV